MPEYPDLTVYLECLEHRALNQRLSALRLGNPFVLRTVEPSPAEFAGRTLIRTARAGKRLVLVFDGGFSAVIHLMLLGRLHWKPAGSKLPKGSGLAAFEFDTGSLQLVESGKKRRASIHLFASEAEALDAHRGGLEVFDSDFESFSGRLREQRHTLKRALTDPRILSAIGNAYSDEILHRARMSPFRMTDQLTDDELRVLHAAIHAVLTEWTNRLREEAEASGGWPKKVTAFRPEMAVHGRYSKPCPDCGSPVQRIVYADREANYCARCQTDGRLLADRSLSRLLKDSWPKNLDDL